MLVKADFSVLHTARWHEYVLRFLLGGSITVVAGLLAKAFGPKLGGLFLAFPAIFPAAVTLVEKHAVERKRKKGLPCIRQGRELAGVEAAGTAMGSVGLFAFAGTFCVLVSRFNLYAVFVLSSLAWATVSAAVWALRKRMRFWHPLHRRTIREVRLVESEVFSGLACSELKAEGSLGWVVGLNFRSI